jgi:hypothetical protein
MKHHLSPVGARYVGAPLHDGGKRGGHTEAMPQSVVRGPDGAADGAAHEALAPKGWR